MAEEVLRAANLSVRRNDREILSALDFSVAEGDFLCVLGPNGSGKTTLLRCLSGVSRPCAGAVRLRGMDLADCPQSSIARTTAYLPQGFEPIFGYSVSEFVQMGRFVRAGELPIDLGSEQKLIEDKLALCRVAHLRERMVSTLSGGERQRVLLAAALAQEPALLVLDEPTTSLDPRHSDEMLEVLEEIRSVRPLTIICATHEINLAARYATHVLSLKGGRKQYFGDVSGFINTETLRELYEREFVLIQHPGTARLMAL